MIDIDLLVENQRMNDVGKMTEEEKEFLLRLVPVVFSNLEHDSVAEFHTMEGPTGLFNGVEVVAYTRFWRYQVSPEDLLDPTRLGEELRNSILTEVSEDMTKGEWVKYIYAPYIPFTFTPDYDLTPKPPKRMLFRYGKKAVNKNE